MFITKEYKDFISPIYKKNGFREVLDRKTNKRYD